MAGDVSDAINYAHICTGNCSTSLGNCTCYQWNNPTTTTWTYSTDPIVLVKLQELEAKLDHLLALFMDL